MPAAVRRVSRWPPIGSSGTPTERTPLPRPPDVARKTNTDIKGAAITPQPLCSNPVIFLQLAYSASPRSRNALKITDAELRLVASAAIMGESSQPVIG